MSTAPNRVLLLSFEVLTTITVMVCYHIMLYILVDAYQGYGTICCLHLQECPKRRKQDPPKHLHLSIKPHWVSHLRRMSAWHAGVKTFSFITPSTDSSAGHSLTANLIRNTSLIIKCMRCYKSETLSILIQLL